MKVKIKKLHKDAVIPKYGKPGDAGMDLVSVSSEANEKYGFVEHDTGIAVEIPEGHVGLVFPRSSISKTPLTLANSVGVIDSNYRGPIKFRFFFNSTGTFFTLAANDDVDSPSLKEAMREIKSLPYEVGDRIGQLIIIPIPHVEFEEVEELSDTERGEGGFGSTGK